MTLLYETDIANSIKYYNNDEPNIYELYDNVYLIDIEKMKSVELFDMVGSKLFECKNSIIDLTPFSVGVYILLYNENKIIKLIRK